MPRTAATHTLIRCGLCSPVRYAAYGQTSGVAQSEVGVAVEGEPFWLDEKAFVVECPVVAEGWPNFGLQSQLLLEDPGGAGFECHHRGPCDLCD
jgi:hypothetical protein